MSEIQQYNGKGRAVALSAQQSLAQLEQEATEINRVADIFAIEGEQLKHIKRAYFYSKISNGLVPDAFQGDYRAIFIMSQLAEAMRINLIEALQGGYFVHGRWGWYAEFMIKRVLGEGFYKEIKYEVTGEKQNMAVRAIGVFPDGSLAHGTTVSMAMATAEGWTKNKKYQTMPELMLKKRAATFLIRETAPHLFGNSTRSTEELEEITIESRSESLPASSDTIKQIAAEQRQESDDDRKSMILDKIEEKIVKLKSKLGVDDQWFEKKLKMPLEKIMDLPVERLTALFDYLGTLDLEEPL